MITWSLELIPLINFSFIPIDNSNIELMDFKNETKRFPKTYDTFFLIFSKNDRISLTPP